MQTIIKIINIMRSRLLFAIFLGSVIISSCSRDNEEETKDIIPIDNSKNIIDLDASEMGKWVYFSFTKDEVVDISTPETDLSWDIAFSRYHIKTNGGTSGKGNGEVAKLDEKDFSKVVSVPVNLQYTKDIFIKPIVRPGMPEQPQISLNNLISGNINTPTGWWSYTPPASGSQIPKTTLNNWVYIVKDAKGIPVKLQLTSYNHSQTTKSGFISFRYKKVGINNQF